MMVSSIKIEIETFRSFKLVKFQGRLVKMNDDDSIYIYTNFHISSFCMSRCTYEKNDTAKKKKNGHYRSLAQIITIRAFRFYLQSFFAHKITRTASRN